MLNSFDTLLNYKRNEVKTKKDRLQIGLDKIISTKDLVSDLQEKLVLLQPQLVTKGKEVDDMMVATGKEEEIGSRNSFIQSLKVANGESLEKRLKKELEEPLEVSTKTGCNIFFAIVICYLMKTAVA